MIPAQRDDAVGDPDPGGDPGADLRRDPVAFIRETQAEVWRFVAALVDPGAADDLTQETYLRAWRAMADFEGRSSARTWLLGIARRVCADHIRAVRRRRRLAVSYASAVDATAEPDHAGLIGLADLLRHLPEDRREAFVLTQILGMSYAEASAVAGVPVGTIRSRVARARTQLVTALTEAPTG